MVDLDGMVQGKEVRVQEDPHPKMPLIAWSLEFFGGHPEY